MRIPTVGILERGRLPKELVRMSQGEEPQVETIRLKNGIEVSVEVVDSIMERLRALYESHYTLFYFMVKACRDPRYQLLDEAAKILTDYLLISGVDTKGRPDIPDITSNIVLSAVTGKGLSMVLEWPEQTS